MTTRAVIDSDGARKADLAAIHIAKAELGWDDDHYRDILFTVCRVKSSAALDFAGRKRFLAHLRACGWAGGMRGRGDPARRSTGPSRSPLTPPQRKMWSLWQQLYERGAVDNRRMEGLLSFVKRQTDVDRLEWLNHAQEQLVVESLKSWLARSKRGTTAR